MRPKGRAEELERRRRRAVELYKKGVGQVEVARIVGSSQSSVSRWLKMASESKTGLAPRPHPGGERRLSDKQHRQLERLLRQGAKANGWSNDLWTASRVKEVVERHFEVSYHRDHVRRILVDRLGWSVQKPERQARERDEEAIECWRKSDFPLLKKRQKTRGNARIPR